MKIQRSTLYYILGIIFYLYINELYFHFYIKNIVNLNPDGVSSFANLHDHLIYEMFIEYILNGESVLVFGNNFGIASIFYSLNEVFGINDYIFLSHYVNIFVYLGISLYVFKVLRYFKYHLVLSLFFSFNPANFYYLSLINKDIFTIFFVLMFIYYLVKKQYFIYFTLAVLSIIIRLQLPLFALTLYFLLSFQNISLKRKIFYLYIISAAAAALLENITSLITMNRMDTSLGLGITKIIRELNTQYYIGSFLLNPVKIIQYFYDYIQAFRYLLEIHRLKDIFNLLFLPISLFSLLTYFFLVKKPMEYRLNVFIFVLISFFTVWLINPTVNYRYIGIFIPYIIIPGIYATKYLFRNKR